MRLSDGPTVFEHPKRIQVPEGTTRYARDDEHGDTFGVREIVQTSSDGTILVSFASGTSIWSDIKVRMNPEKLSGKTLNEIGTTVREFLEARAKFESVPLINAPVCALHEQLRLLLGGQPVNIHQVVGELRKAMQELGIIQEELIKGRPRTLKDMLGHLKTLAYLGVIHLFKSLETVPIITTFEHYVRKLEELEIEQAGAEA